MDRIIETADGFDVVVNGRTFGTWRSRAEAAGGLAVERRREADRRESEESKRLIAQADAETQRHHEWRNRD